jgi:hypothetical protein
MNWNLRYAKDKEESSKGFKPPAGVQSAARHALKLIEDGKAGDGFTSVGRGRAHQLANGETLSLATVKRMHSYFSRHRVDKKGKDWNNDSPGKVAWLAWGGDAGASWAAGIVKKHGGGDSKKEAAVYEDPRERNDRYDKLSDYNAPDEPGLGEYYDDEHDPYKNINERQNRGYQMTTPERKCDGCGADLSTEYHTPNCPIFGSYIKEY